MHWPTLPPTLFPVKAWYGLRVKGLGFPPTVTKVGQGAMVLGACHVCLGCVGPFLTSYTHLANSAPLQIFKLARAQDLARQCPLFGFFFKRVKGLGFPPNCGQGRTKCNDARCMPCLTWVCWAFLDIIHTLGQFCTIANWLGLKTWQRNAHTI